MPDPSRVLFVTRYYWPELIGSAPFSTDIAEWLAARGRRTMVLSGLPHYPGTTVFPAYLGGGGRERVAGVDVERLECGPPRTSSALSRILNEGEFLARGLAALVTGRLRRHEVVLALSPSILSVALAVAARRRNGACIAIVHDIQSGLAEKLGMVGGGHLTRVMRSCERLVLNRTDLVVVLSAEMKHQLRRIGVRTPIEVVPLWVDTEHLQPAPSVEGPPIRVLYSGNLGRKQGLEQVVDLARELAPRRSDIEIVVRGNGSRAAELSEEIARLDLNNIRMVDLQPSEALGSALAAGDIHLVPQRPDAADFAVPSKVFNIMAVGRPFVATALPDSVLWRLQRQSGAFLCVPPDDPPSFAEAVVKLADDSRLRQELGRRGREFVELHYAKPLILDHLLSRLDAFTQAA